MRHLRILIVEDSPTDRELLRYLLETRFQSEAKFREATTLEEAMSYLARGDTDCIILDLQLPDSTGRDTFRTIRTKHPGIPVIVMTHNKDRQLAIDMIAEGAADYVLKNYADEEELFRRVIFAVAKHENSVPVSKDDAKAMQRMETAKASMLSAHQSGQHSAIRDTTVETTSALADMSRKLFGEFQKLSQQFSQLLTSQAQTQVQSEHTAKTVETLDRELLKGHSGRPSMRSQMDLLAHRVEEVESEVRSVKDADKAKEAARQKEALDLKQVSMMNRTKILIAIVALIGTIITATVTYYVARGRDVAPDKGQQIIGKP